VPFAHGGADVGFWHPHTFLQSLILVPVGLVLLPLTLLLVEPLASVCGSLASGLLNGPSDHGGRLTSGQAGSSRMAGGPQVRAAATTVAAQAARAPAPSPRSLGIHAAIDSFVVAVLVVIWVVTASFGYFWPIWVVLPLATALGMHAWFVELGERPELVRRFRGSRALAGASGVAALLWIFFIAVWAVTGHGYFWPIWPLIGLGIVVGALTIAAVLGSPGSAEMAERIETLETSRAGAVDVQDSELRRIERDLHDGAQARLVALGMSLGMAEQKLSEDPDKAGELLAEARVGAEQALRELRDLARGIHPPVLADRGLEAALAALANATPMHVTLSVDVPQRPSSAVESAAYFVTAEALANAAKHARSDWLDIRIARVGPKLEVEVRDDGAGGADPNGSGLMGLRRRVQALDGTLEITSPPGGPTTVYAELPCG
jgi:signal transduction histidine kinase